MRFTPLLLFAPFVLRCMAANPVQKLLADLSVVNDKLTATHAAVNKVPVSGAGTQSELNDIVNASNELSSAVRVVTADTSTFKNRLSPSDSSGVMDKSKALLGSATSTLDDLDRRKMSLAAIFDGAVKAVKESLTAQGGNATAMIDGLIRIANPADVSQAKELEAELKKRYDVSIQHFST